MEMTLKIDSEAFEKSFKEIPGKLTRHLRTALYQSAGSIALQAQRVHDFKTKGGKLERSIQARMNPDGSLESEVIFNEGVATYGKYHHGGTGLYGPKRAKYPIKPKNKKTLYYVSGGQKHFPKKVMHPGIKKDEFIFEAAKVKNSEINKRMETAVALAIA
jgi:hypothetical protein